VPFLDLVPPQGNFFSRLFQMFRKGWCGWISFSRSKIGNGVSVSVINY
jgi:hypothetical protein